MEKEKWKYTDKAHPPVPLLKVGDICYCRCSWDYYNVSHISKCEIRKVEVRWIEYNEHERTELGWVSHWNIDYYIRTDIDYPALKSTKLYTYHLEDGNRQDIYLTPQEVLEENVKEFIKQTKTKMQGLQKVMQRLGYSEENARKLLEIKQD